MLILSHDDIQQLLDVTSLFDALSDGFRMLAEGQWKLPLRTSLDMPDGVALFMPAFCEALDAAGAKVVSVMNSNPRRHLPLIQSKYLYLDTKTGEIASVMDAELMTGMRTAVTSALVTDLLGKSHGRVLAVFGTGVQAWWHVEVFVKRFSIGEVLVFSRTPDAGEQFAVKIERKLGTPARCAVMAELKQAEIICTCSTSATPLFELKNIRASAHINAVGSYRPAAREIGSDIISRAFVVVDTYEAAFSEAGEVVLALEEAAIERNHIYGTIDELVSGKREPPAEDQLTVFKSVGLALEDLVAAKLVYDRARERGIGMEVTV